MFLLLIVVTNFYLHYLSCVCHSMTYIPVYIYITVFIFNNDNYLQSSVTARLRNSYSSHLLTPGVTTRKPLSTNSNLSGVVLLPGASLLYFPLPWYWCFSTPPVLPDFVRPLSTTTTTPTTTNIPTSDTPT